eukprot:scaffold6291_cov230-Isochrysis_galbana.AAC.3
MPQTTAASGRAAVWARAATHSVTPWPTGSRRRPVVGPFERADDGPRECALLFRAHLFLFRTRSRGRARAAGGEVLWRCPSSGQTAHASERSIGAARTRSL